jgi:hypothetical protein
LTTCCGLEVQKPTQAVTSDKDTGNTFEVNPNWARTLPSLIYFSCDIYRYPLNNYFSQISDLIFDTRQWLSGVESHPGT